MLVEPLLRVFLLSDVQVDEMDSLCDLLDLVKNGLSNLDPSDHSSLMITMSRALKKMRKNYEPAKEVTADLVRVLFKEISEYTLENDGRYPTRAIQMLGILLETLNLSDFFSEKYIAENAKTVI